jgi:Xaa-Pro aminopeptidase
MGRREHANGVLPPVAPLPRGEYARRRQRLLAMLEPNSIAIVPAATLAVRSRDTEYPFRQDSDFLYLTGFEEPDAVAVLLPGRGHGEFVLFCHERDPDHALWNGERAGTEGACADFGADDAFPLADIDDILPGLIEGRGRVYYSMGRSADFDARIMGWVTSIRSKVAAGAVPPGEFTDLDHLLHELRLHKSAAEQRQLRQAAAISVAAHRRAMRQCRPGMREFQLEAELQHEYARHGARHAAYPAIVAGGANACTLHYTCNAAKLRRGDLVLIDAGCEYRGYAADVTRTFPVGGRFSRRQRALYDVVLAAQAAALQRYAPGGLERGARRLRGGDNGWSHRPGTVARTPPAPDRGAAYRRFYPHRVGHWLGLDVHDVGDYRPGGEWRQLEAGMVLTVEPGLYIAPTSAVSPLPGAGIGIRIEDDVLVTADGHEVLTAGLPSEPDAIEALMA